MWHFSVWLQRPTAPVPWYEDSLCCSKVLQSLLVMAWGWWGECVFISFLFCYKQKGGQIQTQLILKFSLQLCPATPSPTVRQGSGSGIPVLGGRSYFVLRPAKLFAPFSLSSWAGCFTDAGPTVFLTWVLGIIKPTSQAVPEIMGVLMRKCIRNCKVLNTWLMIFVMVFQLWCRWALVSAPPGLQSHRSSLPCSSNPSIHWQILFGCS